MTAAANDHSLGAGDKLAYTVGESAKALGLSPATVWSMIKEREVSAIKLRGRTLISRTELERVLAGAPSARAA